MKIRGCMGLGDAIYSRKVCEYYLGQGNEILMETRHPEVFSGLDIETSLDRQFSPDINCSYLPRKTYKNTSQYDDVLYFAKITQKIPLKTDYKWEPTGGFAIDFLNNTPDPICLVSDLYMSRGVRGRSSLIPDADQYIKLISALNNHYITVMVGASKGTDKGCKHDLSGKTSVSDLMALARRASFCLTQVGALLPICETVDTPVVSILSHGYRYSGESFINSITPKKVICGENSFCYYDDDPKIHTKVIRAAREHAAQIAIS